MYPRVIDLWVPTAFPGIACLNVVLYRTYMQKKSSLCFMPGIILGMGLGNERPSYIVSSSLIGWAHIQNDPCNGIRKYKVLVQ